LGWIIGCCLGLPYDFVLPFAAILKVVCEEFEELKPIALIIAEKNKKEDDGNELFYPMVGENKKYFINN
jgi:hypothetical protein